MNDKVIIGCAMLSHELAAVQREAGCNLPIVELPRALHNTPAKLRTELERAITALSPEVTTVLLAYGFCGNAFDDLTGGDRRLILPVCSDCIDCLTDSAVTRNRSVDAMYFTPSWVEDEQYIGQEYEHFRAKHGDRKAQRIFREYTKGYHQLVYLDGQAHPPETAACARNKIAKTAADLELSFGETSVSLRLLRKLIAGPWDEEFYVVEPGERFSLEVFLKKRQQLLA